MSSNLRKAAEYWVKAEYAFRFGPHKFTATTQELYLESEDKLRIALTGHSGIIRSAESLGIDVEDVVPARPMANQEAKPKRKRKRERLRLDDDPAPETPRKNERKSKRMRLRGGFL